MIRALPLPPAAEVVVIGDTAYDAEVIRDACDARGYVWIFPANPERVYEGPRGRRPQLRSRLKDWQRLSLSTIRLRASTGKYAEYRRLSRWRVGPKMKPARVLRLSGNTGGAQRWPRAARVFDNEPQAFESDARRRQNLDDQCSELERSRT